MNIEFSCLREGDSRVFDPPVPAKNCLPDWYKQINPFLSDGLNDLGVRNSTVKQCMPVLDAMTAGYVLSLPSDIYFGYNDDGSRNTSWSVTDFECISSHSIEQVSTVPFPSQYDETVLKINNPWIVRTPPGYSCLFTNPFWRFDSPIFVHTGIVDTDTYPQPVNFPFWIQKDFVGTLPFGTPLVQIIPFKREDWDSDLVHHVDEQKQLLWRSATKASFNRYKRFFRSPKVWK